MLSNEYIAGFFDGEGCITLSNRQVKIDIVQKDDGILRLIQQIFGGRIYRRKATKIGGESFVLQLTRKEEQVRFLQAIQPYCFVKKHKVDIAIEFLGLIKSIKERNGIESKLPADNFPRRDSLRTLFYNGGSYGLQRQEESKEKEING